MSQALQSGESVLLDLLNEVRDGLEVQQEEFDFLCEHTLAEWGQWKTGSVVPVDKDDPQATVKRQWLTFLMFHHNPYDEDQKEGPAYRIGDVRAFVLSPDGGFIYVMNTDRPLKKRILSSRESFVRELVDEFASLSDKLDGEEEDDDAVTCASCGANNWALMPLRDDAVEGTEQEEPRHCAACGATLVQVVPQ